MAHLGLKGGDVWQRRQGEKGARPKKTGQWLLLVNIFSTWNAATLTPPCLDRYDLRFLPISSGICEAACSPAWSAGLHYIASHFGIMRVEGGVQHVGTIPYVRSQLSFSYIPPRVAL